MRIIYLLGVTIGVLLLTISGGYAQSELSITAYDVDNWGNAHDIEVNIAGDSLANEVRLIVAKAETDLNLESALTMQHYQSTTTTTTLLAADLLDSDGDAIVEGVPYAIVALDVAGNTPFESRHYADVAK